MTIEQFLKELEQTKDEFVWEISDVLRGKLKNIGCSCCAIEFCPITAVNKKLTDKSYRSILAVTAGMTIGLTREDSISIMQASDKAKDKSGEVLYDQNLFNKLVQATGLENFKCSDRF